MASMIDGDDTEVNFDWDQAQKELLTEAGIDMAKEMETKLLCVAEEVIYETLTPMGNTKKHTPLSVPITLT